MSLNKNWGLLLGIILPPSGDQCFKGDCFVRREGEMEGEEEESDGRREEMGGDGMEEGRGIGCDGRKEEE